MTYIFSNRKNKTKKKTIQNKKREINNVVFV